MPLSPEDPTIIGGFEIVECIGQGGMGRVYKARQVSMDRFVALKVLSPRLAEDRAFVERFLREARSAAKLNHPNIVRAIDVGEADGHHYFAMEFVQGQSLSALLRERGRLSPEEALGIVRQVARALAYAHENHIVHLDVKPPNIMLSSDGLAKLADFGLARHVAEADALLTETKKIFGTPRYMAPEQIRATDDVDGRADIYSLGVTWYEALAGICPFQAPTMREIFRKIKQGEAPDLRQLRPEVSEDTALVIRKMMACDREARYQSAAHLLIDLDALARAEKPPVASGLIASATEPKAPEPRRRRIAALVVGVALTVAVIVACLSAPRVRALFLPPEMVSDAPRPLHHIPDAHERKRSAAEAELRRVLAQSDELVTKGMFGEAMRLCRAFAERCEFPDLRAQVTEAETHLFSRAKEMGVRLAQEAKGLLNRGDLTAARRIYEQLRSFGVAECTAIAEQGLAEIAKREEASTARWSQDAIREAHLRLRRFQEQLDLLQRQGHFSEAVRRCDYALAQPSAQPVADQIRALRERLDSLAQFQSAVLAGARRSIGELVRVSGATYRIERVTDEALLLRVNGGEWKTSLPEIEPGELVRFARKEASMGEGDLWFDCAAFLTAQRAARSALAALERAEKLPLSADRKERWDELERETLYLAAQEAASVFDWEAVRHAVDALNEKFRNSAFVAERAEELRRLRSKAIREIELTRGMVFIPGGDFIYQEGRKEYLPSFYMDRTEVTNRQYAEFLSYIQRTGSHRYCHPDEPSNHSHIPLDWNTRFTERPDDPVVGVDWFDAYAYARWAGKRLPTEKEWEKAARGTEGRVYPWGNTWNPSRANCGQKREKGQTNTLPADSMPQGASPYGCLHMCGNAAEWTASSYRDQPDRMVVRGGSFLDSPELSTTTARRAALRISRDLRTGFRCCRAAEAQREE